MSFRGNEREVDPLVGVGHEVPGADDGAQVVQLTQKQIAQIVSNAVSQTLTHEIQQLGNSPPSATAANNVTHNSPLLHSSFKHPLSSMYQHSRVIVQQAG